MLMVSPCNHSHFVVPQTSIWDRNIHIASALVDQTFLKIDTPIDLVIPWRYLMTYSVAHEMIQSTNKIFISITVLESNVQGKTIAWIFILCESSVQYDHSYLWQLLQQELWWCSLLDGTWPQLFRCRPDWLVFSVSLILAAFSEKFFP